MVAIKGGRIRGSNFIGPNGSGSNKRCADLRKRKSLTSGTVLGGRCKFDANGVGNAPCPPAKTGEALDPGSA